MKLLPRHALALIGCACILSTAAVAAEPDRAPPLRHMIGGIGPGGHGPAPMFLRGVVLDEVQQDKVFAIVHAQEPQLREQAKAVRQAHEALRAMATSGQFDDAKASALAQTAAKAIAATALQQARVDAQIYALLTPEQRSQASEGASRRDPHEGHPRREPRP